MGTKALAPTTPADTGMDISRIEEASAASSQKALISQGMAAALEDGKLLGQLEAFNFITSIGETAIVAIYEKVKKSKTWAYLPNSDFSDGRNFESLDEFCRAKLGKSYNRMQELVANRNAVTQELFDQSEKLGLRQADYNAIKALPLPDREAVQAAIADGSSREEVIAVLLDISEKAGKTAAKVEGLAGDLVANNEVLADRRTEIEALQRKLKRIETGKVGVLTDWPKEFEPLMGQIDNAGTRIRHHIGSLETMRLKAMQIEAAQGEEAGMDIARKLAANKLMACIGQAQLELDALQHSFEQTLGAWAEGETTNATAD
jgi:hypothetical protein